MTTAGRWVLGALCAWTVFLWGNRISNAWSSTTETTSAKVVSTVLAGSFLLFALGGAVVLVRAWRAPEAAIPRAFLLVFCAWTVVVWAVRVVGIVAADHSLGFTIVHAVLGLVSIGLAIALARALRPAVPRTLSTAGAGRR